VFEQKYRGFPLEDLRTASSAVYESFTSDRDAAFFRCFEAGDYESYPIDPNRPVQVGPNRPNSPLWQYRRLANASEVQIVRLQFDSHPDLYALRDEMMWLKKTTLSKGK